MLAERLVRVDAAVRERLVALHPAPPAEAVPAPQLPPGLVAHQPTTEDMWEALKSFPRSTGLGPTGFPVQVLKSVCMREGSEISETLVALSAFVGDILRGAMPAQVKAMWASARLLALSKANGKPRPIAVGRYSAG